MQAKLQDRFFLFLYQLYPTLGRCGWAFGCPGAQDARNVRYQRVFSVNVTESHQSRTQLYNENRYAMAAPEIRMLHRMATCQTCRPVGGAWVLNSITNIP